MVLTENYNKEEVRGIAFLEYALKSFCCFKMNQKHPELLKLAEFVWDNSTNKKDIAKYVASMYCGTSKIDDVVSWITKEYRKQPHCLSEQEALFNIEEIRANFLHKVAIELSFVHKEKQYNSSLQMVNNLPEGVLADL
eukprot:UN17434